MDRMQTRLHRWRLNLKTGAAREEQLSDSITEFGMINSGHAGRDYRYTYAATASRVVHVRRAGTKHDVVDGRGLVKHDLVTGAEERFAFDEGVYGSETAMAPGRMSPPARAAPARTTATSSPSPPT